MKHSIVELIILIVIITQIFGAAMCEVIPAYFNTGSSISEEFGESTIYSDGKSSLASVMLLGVSNHIEFLTDLACIGVTLTATKENKSKPVQKKEKSDNLFIQPGQISLQTISLNRQITNGSQYYRPACEINNTLLSLLCFILYLMCLRCIKKTIKIQHFFILPRSSIDDLYTIINRELKNLFDSCRKGFFFLEGCYV